MNFGLHDLIGADPESILWWQMVVRALLIFFAALLLVRLGATRMYGRYGSLEIVVSIIIGSILGRAVTGNARFFPTLAAALTLVLIHLLLVKLAIHNRRVNYLLKGRKVQLIENGRILQRGMAKADMSDLDLLEALRMQAGIESCDGVKAAYLEGNGSVSVIQESETL